MKIIVNDEETSVDDELSIADLLETLKLSTRHVAVEVNLQLVPRAQHAGFILHDGDRLEVVSLVGGG